MPCVHGTILNLALSYMQRTSLVSIIRIWVFQKIDMNNALKPFDYRYFNTVLSHLVSSLNSSYSCFEVASSAWVCSRRPFSLSTDASELPSADMVVEYKRWPKEQTQTLWNHTAAQIPSFTKIRGFCGLLNSTATIEIDKNSYWQQSTWKPVIINITAVFMITKDHKMRL